MPRSGDIHEEPRRIARLLSGLIWLVTPDCREVVRLTSGERDRNLPPVLRFRLRLHRIFCKFCRRYASQIEFLGNALRRFPEAQDDFVGRRLPDETRNRIKETLRNP